MVGSYPGTRGRGRVVGPYLVIRRPRSRGQRDHADRRFTCRARPDSLPSGVPSSCCSCGSPYAAAAPVRWKVVPTLFWMKAPGRRRAIACVASQVPNPTAPRPAYSPGRRPWRVMGTHRLRAIRNDDQPCPRRRDTGVHLGLPGTRQPPRAARKRRSIALAYVAVRGDQRAAGEQGRRRGGGLVRHHRDPP